MVTSYAEEYTKSNGVIELVIGHDNYPMITELSINAKKVMAHDNGGADFQMASRSQLGNAYNPTQGGDCTGKPSKLASFKKNWSGGLGINENNGTLLGIIPRNYSEPNYGDCIRNEANITVPYYFEFAITLGDDVNFTKNGAIIDMMIKSFKDSQILYPRLSELPVAFPLSNVLPYAYYSDDGKIFYPLKIININKEMSHDVRSWEEIKNVEFHGKAILLSNVENAHIDVELGLSFALYSHNTTILAISHRYTYHDLTLVSTIGSKDMKEQILPDSVYKVRRIMAVGSIKDVVKVIEESEQKIQLWGN